MYHQPEEKRKKKERLEVEPEVEEFHPSVKVEVEQQGDRPVRACRTQQGKSAVHHHSRYFWLCACGSVINSFSTCRE